MGGRMLGIYHARLRRFNLRDVDLLRLGFRALDGGLRDLAGQRGGLGLTGVGLLQRRAAPGSGPRRRPAGEFERAAH